MRPCARVVLILGVTVPLGGARARPAWAQAAEVVQCAKCHANRDFLAGKAATAAAESALYVGPTLLDSTAHHMLRCADCHRGFEAGYPHRAGLGVAPCQTCHAEEGKDWAASIHAANAQTTGDAPTCVGCHGAHLVYGVKDPRSPIYHLNVAALCGRCHADPRIIGKYFAGPASVQARIATVEFPKSVHGAGLTRAGLVVSATCTDCHRAHRVLPADSTESSVNRANIPATCGACHAGVVRVYNASAHGPTYPAKQGSAEGHPRPVCTDCHSAHAIVRADQPQWLLGVVQECGHCHERLYETYFETYHGQVSRLGFGLAAKCSDCHTAHNMRPATDSLSTVYPLNLVATCRQCHPAANQKFVKYYPHPDPTARTRYPALFWSWLFMTTLLVGVMAFFGIHTALWLGRDAIERARRKGGGGAGGAGGAREPPGDRPRSSGGRP